MNPTGALCVIPSRLQVGEAFTVKLKLLAEPQIAPWRGEWNTPRPGVASSFNTSNGRKIDFLDDGLHNFAGAVRIVNAEKLDGPADVVFDGKAQGAYASDTRAIASFDGFSWTEPGFHILELEEPTSGLRFRSNPCYVTAEPPAVRLWWGDPHWQSFFSDGVRCPEELYAFARYESFLDFGAITDHIEALTNHQWDYFCAVTNACNEPGSFATLIGQEWTNHAPGHRNIYVRGDTCPAIRCTDERYDTLPKLWAKLDELRAEGLDLLAIPHHPANTVMGTDWSLGWNPDYEKAVEIYSVWGSSECHEDDGNPRPLKHCDGEVHGQHVLDALHLGYRMGFVGGGDIHDGRPGACRSYVMPRRPGADDTWPQGFCGVWATELTRENIFDAISTHQTYATTEARIYLEPAFSAMRSGDGVTLQLRAAASDGVAKAEVIRSGEVVATLTPPQEGNIGMEQDVALDAPSPNEYLYVRLTSVGGEMAWSSPVWGDEIASS